MVLTRYQSLRPNSEKTDKFIARTFIAGILCFFALYHLCLLFALSFAWLSFADLHVINSLAGARSGFEVAFTVLQFCATIGTVCWAVIQADSSLRYFFTAEITGEPVGEVTSFWKNDPYKKVRSHGLEIYVWRASSVVPNNDHRRNDFQSMHLLHSFSALSAKLL
jgi:hypothetical protein